MTNSPTPTQDHETTDDLAALYALAFVQFKSKALWNVRQFGSPTLEQALSVARHLRIEGDMNARCLAEQIEQAGRAHF